MPESYYNPAQSPEYTVQIRRLQNSDPGNAEEVFNPLFQKLVDNIHANHLYKADLVNGKVPEAQLPDMDYIGSGEKGEANGVAPLGADGKVPDTYLNAQGGLVAQEAAPENVKLGWIDTGNGNILKFYNGTDWIAVNAVWV